MRLLFSSIILIIFSTTLIARESQEEKNRNFTSKHSIELSWARAPYDYRSTSSLIFNHIGEQAPSPIISETGIMALSYVYRAKSWFEFSGTFTFSQCKYENIIPDDSFSMASRFLILPSAKLIWCKGRYISLSSSIGFGVGVQYGDHYSSLTDVRKGVTDTIFPIFQFNLISAEIGGKIYGIAQLGIGDLGYTRIGLGFKF